jgi:hypothetical protein
MNRNLNRGSAQIYQLPAGRRSALGGPRSRETKPPEPYTPRSNEALCSGSWYHEEAIRESQPDFKSLWKR